MQEELISMTMVVEIFFSVSGKASNGVDKDINKKQNNRPL